MTKCNSNYQKKLLLLLISTSLSILCAASDLFIKPTGSGSACTQSSPCTLQEALTQAIDDDHLYLGSGSYTGSGTAVISITKSISLYGGWDGQVSTPTKYDSKSYPVIIDAEGQRRGVYIDGDISPTINGLQITDGNASGLEGYEYYGTYDAGGGLYVNTATATISDNIISKNSAGEGDSYGGGVFLNNCSTLLHNNTITNNIAHTGGGLASYQGTLTISDNTIHANAATGGNGGGLNIYLGTVNLIHNTISDNNASTYGGGLSLPSLHNLIVKKNLIINNRANRKGGGINLWYCDGLFVNNIIADNWAGEFGSGIWMGGSEPTFQHTTITRNTGGDGSGVFLGDSSSSNHSFAIMNNTIIANQTIGIYVNNDSNITYDGMLWGDGAWANGSNVSGSGVVNAGAVSLTGDPAFANPDNRDYHLTSTSAAIDTGIDVGIEEDIDGDARPQNAQYDIGADEYKNIILAPIFYLLMM